MSALLSLLALLLLLAPSPASAQGAGAGAADALRPGDVVRLRIWREPDLSGEFPVDEAGTVVLPKLGPVAVAGEPAPALEKRLVSAYQEFLQHNSIHVTFLRRLQVLGAVRQPGLYPVDATMTLSDVLALAGGAGPQGDPDRVELRRNGVRLSVRLSESMRIADSPIRSGDQLFVPERGWMSRNTGVVTAALTTGVSVLIALLTR